MPNRAPDLAWDQQESPQPRGLTRAAIVRAAVEAADEEGLEGASIRRVAARLGARPMSLYTHIASKDDLIDLMLNEVIGEVIVPEPFPADWREALRQIALRSLVAVTSHPWIIDAYARRPHLGPNAMRHAEQTAAAVAPLGLDAEAAWTVTGIVDDYTFGHAMRHIGIEQRTLPRRIEVEIDPATFPHLARMAPDGMPHHLEGSFELGLDAVLDGIERRFASK